MCAKIKKNEVSKCMLDDFDWDSFESSGTDQKTRWFSPKNRGRFRKKRLPPSVIRQVYGIQTVQDSVKEKDVDYVIEKLEKAHRTLKDIRDECRKELKRTRGGGGGTPPNSGIFHRLIDEDEMANCILKIVDQLFHGEKECEICKIRLNIYEFFLLTQFFFDYIHILEKTKQLAFCEYLNNKVFAGKNKVGVRSFNNYAKKNVYTNFAIFLTDNKNIKFDKRPELSRAKAENYLLAPFQEIGWKFQQSDYFGDLRREIKKVQTFDL